MNYYFISSQQQRFTPFQETIASLGESFLVEEVAQVKEVLPSNDTEGVFFIHLVEPLNKVEEFVKEIRKRSKAALIILVMDDSKGFDLKKHKSGSSGGDSYVSVRSGLESVQEALTGLGITFGETPPEFARQDLSEEFSNMDGLVRFSSHAMSKEMDSVFRHLVKDDPIKKSSAKAQSSNLGHSGESMSQSEEDNSGLTLINDFGDLSLTDNTDVPVSAPVDEGLDLMLSDEPAAELGDLNLSGVDDDLSPGGASDGLSLSDDIPTGEGLDLSGDDPLADSLSDSPLDFTGTSLGDDDLSDDAKEKLREIDAIMESTSSQIITTADLEEDDAPLSFEAEEEIVPVTPNVKSNLDESLVADDLDLDSLDFSGEQVDEEEEKPKKKKKDEKPVKEVRETKESNPPRESSQSTRQMSADFKEVSGAYTVEMERAQATISNLRADREELLNKIQNMEEEKVLHNRQTLTIRSELDERKIELSIVRKKLNEEIADLKDRLKLHDERRLILEEKNRILSQELDKASHRNKIDIRKVQMRERELEQKLELLKSDAETQIRHRDLKILELKRKIDAMEFDMESIQVQEKKSVDSRFELEDKLDKAIKTLRNAITVLEDESDRDSAVQALKKNIDV